MPKTRTQQLEERVAALERENAALHQQIAQIITAIRETGKAVIELRQDVNGLAAQKSPLVVRSWNERQ